MSPKRPEIAQELSCSSFRGSVCEGRLRLVDGEMILFWNEQKSQGWLEFNFLLSVGEKNLRATSAFIT